DGRADTVHDVSDGGILSALAEMALAGNIGADVGVAGTTVEAVPFFFGEDQARYLVALPAAEADKVETELREAGIIHALIGKTIAAKELRVEGEGEVLLADLRKTHEGWFPTYMAAPHTN
ncbi:MAG TPA: AIR synthase-related protein, partial [Rhizomicrobium sp.]|nr:AIR synthase-related protein [Rhizomicrobium sp.]